MHYRYPLLVENKRKNLQLRNNGRLKQTPFVTIGLYQSVQA
jgi:hypothetical protein